MRRRIVFFLLLAIVTALGVALWLSAINVQYRDVNQALPFLTQFWLFATPVAYSLFDDAQQAILGLFRLVTRRFGTASTALVAAEVSVRE